MNRPATLRILTALALACGLILSSRLWAGARFYPLTPIFSWLDPLVRETGHAAGYVIFAGMVGVLGWFALSPKPRSPAIVFFVIAMTAAMLDQSRWQPWFYQYVFMILALGLAPSNQSLNICRLIVAAMYFWSGVQKMNGHFSADVFDWMAEPFLKHLPATASLIHALGSVAPAIEASIGIGLLTRKFRKWTIALAIGMHLLVLVAIGPVVHNWNPVVWPWNLAMSGFVLLLFTGQDSPALSDILWPRRPLHVVALALFGVAPALSFFNLWDAYLSSALYAGNKNMGTIYLSDASADWLPEEIQGYVTVPESGMDELEISDWSFGELNVPPYPEIRIYRNAARRICEYTHSRDDVKLTIRTKSGLFQASERLEYNCSSLAR